MRLTPRLAAIAELIPPGSTVADIGTDHAYLPLYLVQEQISQRVVASDINSAPLQQARETVAAFNCLQKIDLRQGDGLNVIQVQDQINTVVIAGIGGENIIKILEGGREKLKSVERLILQPMKESGALRLYLAHNGYALVRESLALEGRRLYEIIMAKPGLENETDLFRLSLGPRLLEVKPPLLPLLLREKIRKLRIVHRSLQRARQENVSDKLQEVEKTLAHLEEVLSCCCPSGH
jgi:tRNA (adenine22-N1)-methyltransferase